MTEVSFEAVERLLLLIGRFGRAVTLTLEEVSGDPELVTNAPIIVLCTLDLNGPCRPGELQELTGLSSGGVSKLLDRMERAGVVKRAYGTVPGDNRGVLVSITARGRRLVRRISAVIASRLPETKVLLKEIAGVLESSART